MVMKKNSMIIKQISYNDYDEVNYKFFSVLID